MKNILVLGGTGFLGQNLCETLEKENAGQLLKVSRRTGVDLSNLSSIRECLKAFQPDVIYNCAAHVGGIPYVVRLAADILRDNLQIGINLYEAVRIECPQAIIINPLSNCSYPGDANIHLEKDWLAGPVHDSVLSFANAKRIMYFLSECYKNQYGIKTKNFLVPNAFGPKDHTDPNRAHALNGMIIRMILAKRRKDKTFEIWGSGNPLREWGYMKDIAKVLYLSLFIDKDLTYPVNIAQNKGYKIKESAQILSELLHFEGDLVCNTKYKDGAEFKILDDVLFRSIFPSYSFSSHREGILETIKYYEEVL